MLYKQINPTISFIKTIVTNLHLQSPNIVYAYHPPPTCPLKSQKEQKQHLLSTSQYITFADATAIFPP